MEVVRVSVLGSPDLTCGQNGPLTALHSRLLGLLVCERPATVHTDTLADLLWRGAPPRTYPSALRLHITRLRDAIGCRSVIINRPGRGYSFDDTGVDIDSDRFVSIVSAASDQWSLNEHALALDGYDSALGMWRGTPYAGCDDHHVAIAERARLEQVRLNAVEGRLRSLLGLGLAAETIPELRALVAERPDDERMAALLMSALASQGYTADALRVFDQVERRLRSEFGVGPSMFLQQTADAITGRHTPGSRPLLQPVGGGLTSAPGGRREAVA